MHLVFLNQYYPPDVAPTGVMLEGLVAGLVAAGHEVTVLCAAGGYGGNGGVVGCPLSVVRGRDGRDEGSDLLEVLREERGDANVEEKIDANVEHRTSNFEHRTEHDCGGEPRHGAQAAPITGDCQQPATVTDRRYSFANGQAPTLPLSRVIRIRACRFGRGSYLGKLLDYASFYLGVAWTLLWLRPAPERIVALTTPPYLSVLARLLSKFRGADHAHWVMDLYPDVMLAHGMLAGRGPVYRLLAWLARWGMGGRRCAAVLTLGPDMAERVGGRLGGCRLSVVGCRLSVGEEGELAVGAGEEIVRSYSLDVIREEREDANIEHRTSNIEHRTEEDCEGKPRHGSQAQQTTDNGQRTSAPRVEWVPLWGEGEEEGLSVVGCRWSVGEEEELSVGAGEENVRRNSLEVIREERENANVEEKIDTNVEHRTSNVERRTEEDCEGKPRHGAQAQQTTDNGQRATDSTALRRERGWGDEELVLMYSGNMGMGHRFGEILAAAAELGGGDGGVVKRDSLEVIREERENTNIEHRTLNVEHRTEEDCGGEPEHDAQGLPPDASETPVSETPASEPPVSETPVSETPASSVRMRFVFYGGGARKAEVEQFVREHPQCPVEVHDYAPADRLGAHLRSADVHLASLDAAWTGTMVPSKLQGIFQAGRPVVFIGSAASSIGRWVLESGGGWVVPPGDVAGLLAALDEARDPDARTSRGRAARAFAVRNFDKATNVARIISCLTAERGNG